MEDREKLFWTLIYVVVQSGFWFNLDFPWFDIHYHILGTIHYLWEGGMGEKMGGPEILATAKRGLLGKVFVIEGGS